MKKINKNFKLSKLEEEKQEWTNYQNYNRERCKITKKNIKKQ